MRIAHFLVGMAASLSPVVVPSTTGCGTETSTFDPTHDGFGDGGSGIGRTCTPPCGSDEKCSVTGVCIAPNACAAEGDCGQGTVCDVVTNECIPGSRCGAEEATGTSTPPNLLVVFDRSCSMRDKIGGVMKWEIAVDALKALLAANTGKIRFGLELFPDTDASQCAQGAFAVPVASGTEATISTLLTNSLQTADANYPNGPCVTNIDTAMEAAAADPTLTDPMRGNFVLLLTDGKQANCNAAGGDTGTTQIITDLYTQKKVPTFVIGFGGGIDPAQMNTFALAGGAPNNHPTTKYYKAEDQPSLKAALDAIAKKTLSCVFTLSKNPPDSSKIFAFFDNKRPVMRDPGKTNGWEYDAATNTVTFYGAACDELKTAKVTDVDIVFGCPEATPH
jgi:hypothetical protein